MMEEKEQEKKREKLKREILSIGRDGEEGKKSSEVQEKEY